jgi:catechol 2,3-dioxygenase-like lactoylglutathione lyase family enzyme
MHRTLFLAFAIALSTPVFAQLGEPANDLGVRLSHVGLIVKDVEAHKKFWTEALGGTVVISTARTTFIQFPGIYVELQPGEPTAPPAGAILDHFGFVLKDIEAARARWKAANVKYTVGANNPKQGFVEAPDGVRVEVFGDPSLPGPIGMDHIHLLLPRADIPAIQAWYDKNLGGLSGKRKTVANRGVTECVYFHRFNISFSPSDMPRDPSKGRSLAHIAFDVKNVDEFAKKLEAQGIKFDIRPRQLPNSNTKIAFLTDPWGTTVELIETSSLK